MIRPFGFPVLHPYNPANHSGPRPGFPLIAGQAGQGGCTLDGNYTVPHIRLHINTTKNLKQVTTITELYVLG